MNHVAIFFIYFASDWAGAYWASACARNDARSAANWSGIYHLLRGVAILFILEDPWCVVSLAAGGAIGTFIALKYKEKSC